MAEGIGGQCSCGFNAEHLIFGALMSGDSYKIVNCYECKIIKSIKTNEPSLQKCSQCSHAMSDVGYHGRDVYPCPSCMKTELILQTTLMAD